MKDIEKRITKLWHFTSSTQVPVKSRISTRLQTGKGRTFSATTHDTDNGSFADCTLFGPTNSFCQVTNLSAMSLHYMLPMLWNHHLSVANKSTPFSDCLSTKFQHERTSKLIACRTRIKVAKIVWLLKKKLDTPSMPPPID